MNISKEQYAIANKNGIKRETAYMRVYQYGWDIERAITERVKGKGECRKKYDDYVYEMLEENNIPRNVFNGRIYRGWDLVDAYTIPLNSTRKYDAHKRTNNSLKDKRKNDILKRRFLTIGIESIDEDEFNEIKNTDDSNKPSGGLWSSSYRKYSKYKSDWLRFCGIERFSAGFIDYGVLIDLKKNTRLYVIDTMDDLERLYESNKHHTISGFKTLDFEKISSKYDAIYLSAKGQISTRYGRRNLISIKELNLYGWDVECLLIMNLGCIENWEYIDLE